MVTHTPASLHFREGGYPQGCLLCPWLVTLPKLMPWCRLGRLSISRSVLGGQAQCQVLASGRSGTSYVNGNVPKMQLLEALRSLGVASCHFGEEKLALQNNTWGSYRA